MDIPFHPSTVLSTIKIVSPLRNGHRWNTLTRIGNDSSPDRGWSDGCDIDRIDCSGCIDHWLLWNERVLSGMKHLLSCISRCSLFCFSNWIKSNNSLRTKFWSTPEHPHQRWDRSSDLTFLTNDFPIWYPVRSEACASAQTNYRALLWSVSDDEQVKARRATKARWSTNRSVSLVITRLMRDGCPMISSTLPLLFVPDILTFDCSLSPLETYSFENQTQLTRRDHRQEMYCVKMHVQLFPSARVFLSGVMMWDRMSERKTEREMVVCVDFISLLTMLSICLTAFRKEHHRHLTCSLWHLFVLPPC